MSVYSSLNVWSSIEYPTSTITGSSGWSSTVSCINSIAILSSINTAVANTPLTVSLSISVTDSFKNSLYVFILGFSKSKTNYNSVNLDCQDLF